QVERAPDAVAMVFGGRFLSYRQLNVRAERLARRLRGLGVAPETTVGIAVERVPEVVVGLLGILKAGGVYLPLDASYPEERLAFMLRDAGARVVLTEGAATELPSGWQGQTTPAVGRTTSRSFKVFQSSSVSTFALVRPSTQQGQDLRVPMSPDHPAYVIYTSGSTGP
ncbi:MAG: AMP-binding protein, partial [bacterium]|nr:AMP-binding protein [bacterium]